MRANCRRWELVTKILIDIDDETLARATELLGAASTEDTVNTALRELVERLRRMRALERLGEIAQTGQFDELLNKSTYRRSNRPGSVG